MMLASPPVFKGPPTAHSAIVVDNLLADPHAYRAAALTQTFLSMPTGDQVFHGIANPPDDQVNTALRTLFPWLMPTLTFLRSSPADQVEPHYLHTDQEMGTWSAILYLNERPQAGDGTIFWRHRQTGALRSEARTDDERRQERAHWTDLAQWEPETGVQAACNRCVVFDTRRFHSRAFPGNVTPGTEARLIQVVFGTGSLDLGSR